SDAESFQHRQDALRGRAEECEAVRVLGETEHRAQAWRFSGGHAGRAPTRRRTGYVGVHPVLHAGHRLLEDSRVPVRNWWDGQGWRIRLWWCIRLWWGHRVRRQQGPWIQLRGRVHRSVRDALGERDRVLPDGEELSRRYRHGDRLAA